MTTPKTYISLDDVCLESSITKEVLITLVDEGIIRPEGNNIEQWTFDIRILHVVKKACRLHRDLDINWSGVALAIQLIEELESKRRENARLKQQLRRFMRS